MRLQNWLRRFLIWIGRVPKPDFITKRIVTHPTPDQIKPGLIVVVGDHQIQKWACFQCPGGCSEIIKLSLNRNLSPSWLIQTDRYNQPTISPSIRQINECQCHFWIRKGQVEWCGDSGIVTTYILNKKGH
jgi:Family of unknown function (DUF6527)